MSKREKKPADDHDSLGKAGKGTSVDRQAMFQHDQSIPMNEKKHDVDNSAVPTKSDDFNHLSKKDKPHDTCHHGKKEGEINIKKPKKKKKTT